ncbi:kinase-like domain-containing protein [Rhizophagus irregularis DAOM 181602=DAOM 197198]|nr:kinase-like domain-containing protein [Rhizophagus irregularis DAOM 181602=DAOM 197198]
MEELMLSSEVIEQIKDFNYQKLTSEQSLLIDKLILNEELKNRFKWYGLCNESEFLKEIESHMVTSFFGFCRPANVVPSQDEYKEIYGVLPYVAPEVVRGKEYTKESDIYSFEPINAIDDNSIEYSESIESIDFTKLNLDKNN